MTAQRPRRVALVGIDGSGKTSLARRLRERAEGDLRLAVLHTIRPHEAPDAPFQALSRHLEALSGTADALRSPELKVAAFYLQLCTFSPIERFFRDAFEPELVLCDRHPLVDSLVYLPLYGRAAEARPAGVEPPDDLAERLAPSDPGALDAIVAWNDLQARRLGYEADLWSLGREMLALHAEPRERLLEEFAERFRAELPDAVVMLELDVEEALGRSGSRGQSEELHENAAELARVRDAYGEVLDWLSSDPRGVGVHRVANADSLDAAVDEVAAKLGLELPSMAAHASDPGAR